LIAQGRVTIDGEPAQLGSRADPATQVVAVDGKPLPLQQRHHYLALHKPPGLISTRHDPEGRPTVMTLIPDRLRKLVYPVGRLDADSEGLLFLFDDGELANALTHPRFHAPKLYQVLVAGNVGPTALAKLRKGIALEEGMTAPAHAKVLSRMADTTVLEMTLREGRKRQLRRMLELVGHPVRRLVRVAIAGVELGDLPPGKWRELKPEEIERLRRAVKLTGDDVP
ncbi:MAG: rRNA pseudouridine synthase, partial [Armatimonadetes bacterium]|nr:rRNA pseudouridine synthase [Armatimonadota bacterium]